mgnify:CR=1 FL=1
MLPQGWHVEAVIVIQQSQLLVLYLQFGQEGSVLLERFRYVILVTAVKLNALLQMVCKIH